MNPKKNSKGKGAPTDADEMEDTCFDNSPFSSAPMVNLHFKRGDRLSVHQALLQQYPKLAVLATSNKCQWDKIDPPSIFLKHISRSAGHVLVHHLYTGTYHTLKWMDPTTGREEAIAKLKTGFEVYATARKYELDGLEELAKEQISLLSKEMDAFTIVDVVHEAYPSSTDKDSWFPAYMKTVLKAAFENPAALLKSEVHAPSENEVEDNISTAKTLLRGVLEVYHEMVKDASVKADSPLSEDDGRETFVSTEESTKDESTWAIVEEPHVKDSVEPAEPGLNPVDDDLLVGVSTKKKKEKKKKKKGKDAVAEEPQVEELPAKPEPAPAEIEDSTATSKVAGGSLFPLFGSVSTTGTAFGATNQAPVVDPPSTVGVIFTPTKEKDADYPNLTNSFQNVLFTDGYKRWSSEELRLADQNRDRKQGGAGGTGTFGLFGWGNTGFGANAQADAGFGAATGTGMFGTQRSR